MIALGNDVADLKEIPKNGKHYYNRLKNYAFTASELALIDELPHEESGLKVLWSLKESAYKSSVKVGNRDRFIPGRIHVLKLESNANKIDSELTWENFRFGAIGQMNNDHIHVISFLKRQTDVNFLICQVTSQTENQSLHVRKQLLEQFPFGTKISKDENGIPWVVSGNRNLSNEISLSHHGRFVAYAAQK